MPPHRLIVLFLFSHAFIFLNSKHPLYCLTDFIVVSSLSCTELETEETFCSIEYFLLDQVNIDMVIAVILCNSPYL
jgi:hypothetical protein